MELKKKTEIRLPKRGIQTVKEIAENTDTKEVKKQKNRLRRNLCDNDLSGNRTRVYAVRGRRLDRLTNRPYTNRGDKIRTCGLCVPNAALYQTEPRLDTLCISVSLYRIPQLFEKSKWNFVFF